ncbi:MAG: hypothetical protein ACLFTA_00780 [Candidatus Nanohaloarchaea archaeon]
MNKFLEAASSDGDDSSDRYEKLKKEEAGTEDEDLARKRFEKLKEEAKQEYIEKHKKQEQEEEEEDDEPGFVTH